MRTVLFAVVRLMLCFVAGVALVALLWHSFVGRALDGIDAVAIGWQATPFLVAAVAVASRRMVGPGLVAAAVAAGVALAAYALAWRSRDPFAFVFVLVAPAASLIAVAALVGLSAPTWGTTTPDQGVPG